MGHVAGIERFNKPISFGTSHPFRTFSRKKRPEKERMGTRQLEPKIHWGYAEGTKGLLHCTSCLWLEAGDGIRHVASRFQFHWRKKMSRWFEYT